MFSRPNTCCRFNAPVMCIPMTHNTRARNRNLTEFLTDQARFLKCAGMRGQNYYERNCGFGLCLYILVCCRHDQPICRLCRWGNSSVNLFKCLGPHNTQFCDQLQNGNGQSSSLHAQGGLLTIQNRRSEFVLRGPVVGAWLLTLGKPVCRSIFAVRRCIRENYDPSSGRMIMDEARQK